MQGVLAPPRGSSVQAFGLLFVAAALGLGDPLFDMPVEMTRLEFLPIARGYGIFEPQIQSHGLFCATDR